MPRSEHQIEPVERLQCHGAFGIRELHGHGADEAVLCQAPDQDIGQDIEAINEVELLEDHRAIAAPFAQGFTLEGRDLGPPKRNRSLRGVDEAVDQAEHGGLASAGASDDAHKLAGLDVECDVIDGAGFVENLGDVGEGQGSWCRHGDSSE